jgi:hypothetical protein
VLSPFERLEKPKSKDNVLWQGTKPLDGGERNDAFDVSPTPIRECVSAARRLYEYFCESVFRLTQVF